MGAQHFEFCGPHGPIGIVIGLPLVCYGLVYSCNSGGCLSFKDRDLPGFPAGTKLITFEGFSVFLGWMSLVLLLHLVLPGKKLQGSVLANKTKLTYKLNGELLLICARVLFSLLSSSAAYLLSFFAKFSPQPTFTDPGTCD